MQNNNNLPFILVDHREIPSGIPVFLQKEAAIQLTTLKTGDYVINHEIVVERKSSEDFIQSLMSNRLFNQCARLSRSGFRPFMLMEGNPCKTKHQIDDRAVKGALLSVVVAWQIPIIYSDDKYDSARLLFMLGKQMDKHGGPLRLYNYKPKRIKSHRLHFLQGLPQTGPVLAHRLYEYFGSIEAVVNATEKELQQVEGIGKKAALKIRIFLSEK